MQLRLKKRFFILSAGYLFHFIDKRFYPRLPSRGIPNVSANPQCPLRLAFQHKATAYTQLHYSSVGKRRQGGQRGAAKILWGSPTEQTMEEMLAIKVELKHST